VRGDEYVAGWEIAEEDQAQFKFNRVYSRCVGSAQ
jgi:hypothetical protein